MNDKEDVLHLYNWILLSHKKNEIMSFVATWMELQIIIRNEVNQLKTCIIWYWLYLVSKKKMRGISIVIQWKWIQLVSLRMWVWHQSLLSGLGIQHFPELWYSLQKQLRSHIAMAVVWASSHSSNLTPNLASSICLGCSHKTQKKKKDTSKRIQKTEVDTQTQKKKKKNLWLPKGNRGMENLWIKYTHCCI